MTIKKLKYKSIPGYGLMNETAHSLRIKFFKSFAKEPDYLMSSKLTLDNVQHNIESYKGKAEHPLAIAEPLLFEIGKINLLPLVRQ